MEQFFADLLERLDYFHGHYFQYMDSLTTEQLDWIPGKDMNSLCVLAVHVSQAERYWIGLGIGDPIERNRAAEFEASGYTLDELKQRFTDNMAYYKQAFESATTSTFDQKVTVALFPERTWETTRSWALLHALDHSAEHLGHAGMTRQLLDANDR